MGAFTDIVKGIWNCLGEMGEEQAKQTPEYVRALNKGLLMNYENLCDAIQNADDKNEEYGYAEALKRRYIYNMGKDKEMMEYIYNQVGHFGTVRQVARREIELYEKIRLE